MNAWAIGFLRCRLCIGLWLGLACLCAVARGGNAPEGPQNPSKPFSIEQREGRAWLVRPEGRQFFSFWVCCVNQGDSAASFDASNPSYAASQHYATGGQWVERTLNRLKAWGVTTIGAWSDFASLRQSTQPDLVFTPVLHIGSTAGAPWWDMWDPKVVERMDQIARPQILALRDDPRLLGYYTDNELGWWEATLFKMTLEQTASSDQRRRLIDLLRASYHSRWDELLKDFEPEAADDWNDLEQRGMLYLRPGGQGIRVMRRYLGLLAERYYSLVHEIIRKYDHRALILGDRYQSFFYPEVAQASARYVDAVSSNLNAGWSDGSFPRFYLETLHALTRKPILVSEFYMAARDNRSGNRNNHGVFPVAQTQKERARGALRQLRSLLALPWVIGADWFQYYDEPTHGRYDGENFNFGLVDVNDQPYSELTTAFGAVDLSAIKSKPAPSRLDATLGVPPAPHQPMGQFEPTRALLHWDRERGFVPPCSELPQADMYICWDPQSIYLGLYAQDPIEDAFYRGRIVPKNDRAEWIIAIVGSNSPVRARLGAGLEPLVNHPSVGIVNLSGLNLNVRNIAAMALPARLFGKTRFHSGDAVEFSATLYGHLQSYRVDWKGTFRLAK